MLSETIPNQVTDTLDLANGTGHFCILAWMVGSLFVLDLKGDQPKSHKGVWCHHL